MVQLGAFRAMNPEWSFVYFRCALAGFDQPALGRCVAWAALQAYHHRPLACTAVSSRAQDRRKGRLNCLMDFEHQTLSTQAGLPSAGGGAAAGGADRCRCRSMVAK
jgi:hypothetical protein